MFIDLFFVSLLLFLIGVYGLFCIRTNLLFLIMTIEILFYSSNLLFLHGSLVLDDLGCQLFSFLILTIAAAESTIGLAIVVSFYRRRGDIVILERTFIKG